MCIRDRVETGTYMGANEAYLVDESERDRLANHIFFFFRDGIGEMPEELELLSLIHIFWWTRLPILPMTRRLRSLLIL